MRVTAFILGILGGLAGVVYHAVLLVRFFAPGYGLPRVFIDLALAVVLAVAALVLVLVFRRSPRVLAVFLPLIGVLGLVPRPLSWAPVALLLIAGGVASFLSARSNGARPTPHSPQRSPEGPALHWSEAARLLVPMHAVPLARPPQKLSRPRDTKVAVPAVAIASVAVVLTLCIWTPGGSTAGTSDSAAATSTVSSANTASSTPFADLASYKDTRNRFTISYPAAWEETALDLLGDSEVGDSSVVGFADRQGPTSDGRYLNFVEVMVAGDSIDRPSLYLSLIKEKFDEGLAEFRKTYPDATVIVPIHATQIGSADGLSAVITFSTNGSRIKVMEGILVAEGMAYQLELSAVEADWHSYLPIFKQILASFATGPDTGAADAPQSTTTTTNDKAEALTTYSDSDHGFSIGFPTAWRNTDPHEVGQRIYTSRAQAEETQYIDAYVAAAFADWQGPTFDGCYLDYVWIEVYDDIAADEAALAEIRDVFEREVAAIRYDFPEVNLLQPFRSIQVGTATGFEYIWSVPVDDRRVVMRDCVLIDNECVYYLRFSATEADWKNYQTLFQEILESFSVRGPNNLT